MASGSECYLWLWLAGGCRWNLWVCLVCVVVRRYIDFLILLIPTPLVYICVFSAALYFLFILKMFFVLVLVLLCHYILGIKFFSRSINTHTGDYGS